MGPVIGTTAVRSAAAAAAAAAHRRHDIVLTAGLVAIQNVYRQHLHNVATGQ